MGWLDSNCKRRVDALRNMRPFHRVVAVVLLLLWGTVTVHCGLEVDGLFGTPSHAAKSPVGSDSDPDGCGAIENGYFAADSHDLAVVQPLLAVEFVLHEIDLIPFGPRCVACDEGALVPPELLPSWTFTRRASPPSRAPDFVS